MFLDDNFLLQNEWAKNLFHKFAKDEPIIDYHCHLEPAVILENKRYQNLSRLWLSDEGSGDHYKWRLMRANGVPESLISGDGDDYEKFVAFASTLEKAIGSPIYEWSHLELRRYFDIDLIICQENASEIWKLANAKIVTDDYRPQELLRLMNVKAVCTTDDPIDSLESHKHLSKQKIGFKVLPTFRPDNVWNLQNPDYKSYLNALSKASDVAIKKFSDIKQALNSRVEYFNKVGCRLADQGLNTFIYTSATTDELDDILSRALQGEINFSAQESAKFVTAIQLHLMKLYTSYGWTMQMHMNALRNDSTKMQREIGINVGGDSMGDQPYLTSNIVSLFAEAEERRCLPKTILYSLNPNDWLPLATAMQSFQGDTVQKLQLGCAWWFNDTCEGMSNQLTIMAQQSLLGNFTGMLTDSRSFLSYPRHEYFRRVLCQLVGEWVEQGRVPTDEKYLGKIIQAVCYKNAYEYFGFFNN
ncbi:glucuronate isomerase [Bacillus pseudomycoides]|uniref:glucuronate isomerase n=1 Tax=Bacillus pseudomycoides TaxID=64104 RepID=UPI000BFA0C91|nr:glucuronate isomerase [Bacillus pseudomycoides]PGC29334.1 glucuronate isomerase [Bacillus pseudomycoides]